MTSYTYTSGAEPSYIIDPNPVCIGWKFCYDPYQERSTSFTKIYKVIAMNDKYVVIKEQVKGFLGILKDDQYSYPIIIKLKHFKKKAVRYL